MPDEKDELVRRLQAQADGMRDQPIELTLANMPGPFRLPKCQRAGVNILDGHRAELIFDTERGQRILVEMDSAVFESLHGAMSFALKNGKKT